MNRHSILLTILLTITALSHADTVNFTPPQGWKAAEIKELGPNVKIMVVGPGKSEYPPSMNLVVEPFEGNSKDYLNIVKAYNEKKGDKWQSLGDIKTAAGTASLSQVDAKTSWGTERLMHVILKRNGNIYILTAAALQPEFAAYYKEFFKGFRSLSIDSTN